MFVKHNVSQTISACVYSAYSDLTLAMFSRQNKKKKEPKQGIGEIQRMGKKHKADTSTCRCSSNWRRIVLC